MTGADQNSRRTMSLDVVLGAWHRPGNFTGTRHAS